MFRRLLAPLAVVVLGAVALSACDSATGVRVSMGHEGVAGGESSSSDGGSSAATGLAAESRGGSTSSGNGPESAGASQGGSSGGSAPTAGQESGETSAGGVSLGGASSGGESSGGESSGGESSGGESSGGESSGGESSGGESSGGSSSGGTSSGGRGVGGSPSVDPQSVGHVDRSCGAFMWSLDGETFLDCFVGGEHEGHPECVIVDCEAHGDTGAFCVFSNHCSCSDEFQCESTGRVGGECEPREGCVPVE